LERIEVRIEAKYGGFNMSNWLTFNHQKCRNLLFNPPNSEPMNNGFSIFGVPSQKLRFLKKSYKEMTVPEQIRL
jgi:O-glycosyl hydrolase